MMQCADYRRSLLADPQHPSAEMRSHVATCHDCAAYTDRLLRFESRLERAVRLDVPSEVTTVGHPIGSAVGRTRGALRQRRGLWAMAASVLLGVGLVGALWLGAARSSLAAAVVGHMAEEPDAWARTDVPAPQLNEVLRKAHVELRPSAGLVSYASSCGFRGHVVPHLVVQTAAGPVTVMVLPDESVHGTVHFDEQGYRGMIVPVAGHGSLAVLEKAPNTDMKAVEDVAARVLGAIKWTS